MTGWRNHNKTRAVLLTGAEAISRIIAFVVVVRLINYLGDAAYGELSYAFALANILVIVADFGLGTYVVKHFALAGNADETTEARRQHFGQVVLLKLSLVVIALALIIATGLMLTDLSWLTIIGGGCAIVFTNARMFVEALFRAQQRMTREALTKIGHAVILASVLLYGMARHYTLEQFALAYGVVAIIAAFTTIILLWRLPLKPRWHGWQTSYWQTVVVAAWPFAASFGINALFNYLDSVMLGWFGQFEATGWYNTAYKPIFFLTALAGMVINAYLPTIAAAHRAAETVKIRATVQELFNTTMLVAWPMMVGGTLVADKLFELLFKPEFAPGILAFQILLWSTGCIYAWAVFGNSLQVCGKEKVYLKNFSIAVIITIIGNAILIPRFSLYGAAVATLLTQATLVVLMFRAWQKLEPIVVWRGIVPAIVGSAIMGVVVWLMSAAPLWLIVLAAAVVYGGAILMSRALIKRILPS